MEIDEEKWLKAAIFFSKPVLAKILLSLKDGDKNKIEIMEDLRKMGEERVKSYKTLYSGCIDLVNMELATTIKKGHKVYLSLNGKGKKVAKAVEDLIFSF